MVGLGRASLCEELVEALFDACGLTWWAVVAGMKSYARLQKNSANAFPQYTQSTLKLRLKPKRCTTQCIEVLRVLRELASVLRARKRHETNAFMISNL